MSPSTLQWRRGSGSYWYYTDGKYGVATIRPLSPYYRDYTRGHHWTVNIDGAPNFKLLKQAKSFTERAFRKSRRRRK